VKSKSDIYSLTWISCEKCDKHVISHRQFWNGNVPYSTSSNTDDSSSRNAFNKDKS